MTNWSRSSAVGKLTTVFKLLKILCSTKITPIPLQLTSSTYLSYTIGSSTPRPTLSLCIKYFISINWRAVTSSCLNLLLNDILSSRPNPVFPFPFPLLFLLCEDQLFLFPFPPLPPLTTHISSTHFKNASRFSSMFLIEKSPSLSDISRSFFSTSSISGSILVIRIGSIGIYVFLPSPWS